MNAAIRLAEKRDVPGILEIYAPFILETAVTFEEIVPDEASFWERIQGIMAELPDMPTHRVIAAVPHTGGVRRFQSMFILIFNAGK